MPFIRQAEKNDITGIEYVCRMTAGPESRRREDIGRKMSLTYSTYYARCEQETCFVLDDDGKVAGYILCAPDFKRYIKGFHKNEIPQIWKIDKRHCIFAYMMPLGYLPFIKQYPAHLHIDLLDEYQGKGYGTKMIQALIDRLIEKGISGVMLIVDKDNHGAQRFYERAGFKKAVSLFGGVVMTKKL